MHIKRSLLFGAGGGAIVVWIAAASTSVSRLEPAPGDVKPAAVEVSGAALASEVARLHERLRPSAVPMQARDLFRYASRARVSAAPTAPVLPMVTVPSTPADPAPLKLVGIAEDAGANGPIRTAILTGFGELFLVKEGDAVAARYTVVTIGDDGIELLDDRDKTTLRIALK